ncbi:hypothetical protein C1H46_009411 [Malus baccata]|uniref:Uncharacterized protein n=1 Tax=Malus baccata TaxID=106549 RepID=A0A540N337_MALBA|nr:hypothetical protein C1H46_009411 [Malus baccata]
MKRSKHFHGEQESRISIFHIGFTANFDWGFELEQIGLLEKDFPGRDTDPFDLRLRELNLLPRLGLSDLHPPSNGSDISSKETLEIPENNLRVFLNLILSLVAVLGLVMFSDPRWDDAGSKSKQFKAQKIPKREKEDDVGSGGTPRDSPHLSEMAVAQQLLASLRATLTYSISVSSFQSFAFHCSSLGFGG